jgi:trehalose 6-phosphate synthase
MPHIAVAFPFFPHRHSCLDEEMLRVVRFLLPLLLVLGLLSVATYLLVIRTSRSWSERDVALRSELAVGAAREALLAHWRSGDRARLERLLGEITRDVRIMAAAACAGDGRSLVATSDYPAAFTCEVLRALAPVAPAAPAAPWHQTLPLRGGSVHASIIPLREGAEVLGSIVLLHDMSYAERRERTTGWLVLLALAVLAAAASAVTAVAARLAWRRWNAEVGRVLREGTRKPEFLPILQEVRELVARLSTESELEAQARGWTPQRLKQVLRRHLHGERVLIVANREPYIHERTPDGGVRVLHPASGLVTALEPVMRACSGVWIAHGAGSADRETADPQGRVRVPPGEESYLIRRVWLSREDEMGYYYGFANEGLWPLCHIAHTRPTFRRDDFSAYERVNRQFAAAASDEADTDDPIIFVQDYHFALAPQLIRERLPRALILTFWHIPWPNAERFGICPYHDELLTGLLGSSILGFHTQLHCNNFLDAVDRFLEARIDREQQAVVHHGRVTLVRPYPISIEWPSRWLQDAPPVAVCRQQVLAEIGLREDIRLGLGVDRLDYTKGIEERLLAVERALERFPALLGRFTFVQLAAPSRTVIAQYRELNERVEALAARINQRFAAPGYRPVVLLRAHHEPEAVFRYYRAADLCYVSSLHDGMNLVAKEYVAARDDEQGVLVLSHFTGAARELTEALVVNPYDLDEASAALATALAMSPEEQAQRMRAMRRLVSEFNVYRWAGRMLTDAARLRERERLAGRLAGPQPGPRAGLEL